jgi:hypothetical protein
MGPNIGCLWLIMNYWRGERGVVYVFKGSWVSYGEH